MPEIPDKDDVIAKALAAASTNLVMVADSTPPPARKHCARGGKKDKTQATQTAPPSASGASPDLGNSPNTMDMPSSTSLHPLTTLPNICQAFLSFPLASQLAS
jgi:hypothetical protein